MRFYSIKFIGLLFFCVIFITHSQAQSVAFLKKQLLSSKSDSISYHLFYTLAEKYEFIDADSSVKFLENALKIAETSRNSFEIANSMCRLGYMYMYYIKDETKAMEYFNKVIEIAKKENDYLNLAKCYQRLSIISQHQNIGNPNDLLSKSLEYAKKSNNWKVIVEAEEIYSEYFRSLKKYKQAAFFTYTALKICKKYNIDYWFTGGLEYYELLKLQNKADEAAKILKELNINKSKLKKSKGEFVYLNDVGRLEMISKNYIEAEKLFLKSLESEKSKPKVDTFHLYFIFQNLENLYLGKGDYKKAHQSVNQLMEVNLWLQQKRQTQDSKLQMTKMKANLDIEKKEVEIALLENIQKQQKYFLIGATLFSILLLSFLIFLQKNNRQIEMQKAELSQLNTTKDKIFAILSHDLRSPVAALKNYMMLINWGALNQVEFADATKGLNTQLNQVHSMVENVLNWSISQMGGMSPQIALIEVLNVVQEQIQLMQTILSVKNIDIKNNILPSTKLLIDKNHLEIIFRNLLQNAVKFTGNGGEIILNLYEKGEFYKFEISDNGVGIPKEKLADLFQLSKFTTSLGTNNEQGTGLGLALVKELVELNNGKISVTSEMGVGTTFTILWSKKDLVTS
jgi:signal transduction histidine kinase